MVPAIIYHCNAVPVMYPCYYGRPHMEEEYSKVSLQVVPPPYKVFVLKNQSFPSFQNNDMRIAW